MTRLTEQDVAPEGSVSSTGPPGVSGDTARPNYMGPSGQPGWWGRMNAGKARGIKGVPSVGRPCPPSEGGLEV